MFKIALVATSVALLHPFSGPRPTPVAPITVADTSPSFTWTGTVPNGGWLRIRNIAGSIEVKRASGNTVEVRAAQEPERWSWNVGRVLPVRFVVQRQGSDVVVCAISDDVPRCDANNLSTERGWDDDTRPQAMHVTVTLPAGVSLQAGTMHGDLSINDAGGEVIARSGHGNITVDHVAGTLTANSGHGNVDVTDAASRVSANTGHGNVHVANARGGVRATTGHGDITAELASTAGAASDDMRFETGHGNVSVVAPSSLSGSVDLRTGRGRVSTSFPLTKSDESRYGRSESAYGTLGSGGRSVRLSSGHGDVSLTSGR